MKRDNGDYNLFKFVGIGAILFCLFMIIGSRFVTVGLEEPKPVQKEPSEYLKQEIQLEDAKILGKFWNDKGHFIVVYNGLTKVPEILEVGYSEWQYMRIGKSIRNKLNITTYISKLVGEFSKYLLS